MTLFEEKSIHADYDGSRIIVISDIHGGIDLFDKLLEKVNYTKKDYLIILGDFIQRGYQNIETLERMIDLSKEEKVYILSGNHEHYLCSILEPKYIERLAYHLENIHYGCLIREWMTTDMHDMQLERLQETLKKDNKEMLDFLRNLPYALELNDHLFVHGGLNRPYKASSAWDLLSSAEFLKKEHDYSYPVVVGHWPVQNYKEASLSGYPIFDFDKNIIAIDGGYGVKESGQINALIIEEGYSVTSIDNLRQGRLSRDIELNEQVVVKLDYLDKAFEVLEKREEFSLVQKKSTQEQFLLKNELLEGNFGDYISRMIHGKKDQAIGIINQYGNYYLVKCQEKIGWVRKSDVAYETIDRKTN